MLQGRLDGCQQPCSLFFRMFGLLPLMLVMYLAVCYDFKKYLVQNIIYDGQNSAVFYSIQPVDERQWRSYCQHHC